jgi:hypothetical protein
MFSILDPAANADESAQKYFLFILLLIKKRYLKIQEKNLGRINYVNGELI